MKKLIVLIALAFSFVCTQAQTSYEGYLAALDTLTNADSHSDTVTITGNKHCISFQSRLLKISGTVAGTVNIYGSLDGTNFGTTALTTINLTDASAVWNASYTYNGYKKYRIVTATTGTSSASVRHYLLYRKE